MNSQPPTDTQETTITAGKLIEQVISRDQDCPDLATLLNGSPSEAYIKPLLNPDEEFVQTNRIPIPRRFFDRIVDSDTQCRCFMGLLPEVGRAWLTIDCALYIWSLTDENDYYEYSDQDQIIVKVELVKPKSNVFGDHIKHVLVLSTPLQIILLAVATNQAPTGTNMDTISLFATNLSMPADDEQMEQIGGTDEGRIFMIGKSGSMYEVEYNNPMKWFSRCRLINRTESTFMCLLPSPVRYFVPAQPQARSFVIDNERKVLYILYRRTDAIEVVYLGDRTNNYKPIFTLSNIRDNALSQCRQQNRICNSSDFDLESLHVISRAESKRIHLMAVTTTGYRLYFSHYRDSFRGTGYGSQLPTEPNTLELGHIRLPPPVLARSAGQLPPITAQTYYDCGIYISVWPKTDTSATIRIDSVTSATAAQPPTSAIGVMAMGNRPAYSEVDISVEIDETVMSVTETNQHLVGRHYLKEISQQWADPPRQFIVLTTLSVLFFSRLRPVDILYKIFLKAREEFDTNLIQSFFERYGQIQACAMCLSIGCSSDENDIVIKANDTFFAYGGLPTSTLPAQLQGNHLGRAIGQTDVAFSGKHDGFVLYFARIVSPVWKLKVFTNYGNDTHAHIIYTQMQSTVSNTKDNLSRLKDFMDRNPKFHDSVKFSDARYQSTDRNLALLESAEQKSVHALYLMLVQCIESLSFIEFLFDSTLQAIISDHLHHTFQTKIYDLDINAILTKSEGRELIRELVIATIAKYESLYAQGGFDFVSNHLGRFCSTFFSTGDISFFKGIEYLRRAMHDESDYERIDSLKHSLFHLKEAANSITDAKMEPIRIIYQESSFHVGILELALARAQQMDPENQALKVYESPSEKSEAATNFLDARSSSYRHIFFALQDLVLISKNGVPANRVPIPAIVAYIDNVFATALKSDDKVFHYQLYNWFLEQGLEFKLLTFETPYLISYFENFIPDKQRSLRFLARYHMQKFEYLKASRCLHQLATLPSPTMNLHERVDLLIQAATNAQIGGHRNENLMEKARLAGFQCRIKDIIESNSDGNIDAKQAVRDLNQRLFAFQELKELFGNRFQFLNDVFSQEQTYSN
ncbi:Nup133 N terminal like-domain-containing protein [Parasitella parasitica]|nr:Nup133 N terminal like-domain-containing protein [Parasitella parasitica]